MNRPDFWQDPTAAQTKRIRAFDELKKELATWQKLGDEAAALKELTDDPKAAHHASDLEAHLAELEADFAQLEFTLMLNGPYDDKNAILSVHAGTGGTDAQDWTARLLRMFLRFSERKGWATRLLDESRGGEAGLKSATAEIIGRYAYGYLRSEAGVHRLVRISPFDAEKMRHTSFALVEVIPDFGELPEFEIDPKELKIVASTSSGHGGQSVNTTYSAIRIVHLPTGLTVSCQNERSQKQNRETALKILKAKLHQRKLEEQEAEKKKLRGEYHSAEWGNQIRSYVLQPYKMVKDHRTKFETTDPDSALDGNLEPFIEAYLKSKSK